RESDHFDNDTAWDIVTGITRIAPDSSQSAAILLKALRHKGVRSIYGAKNEWYMRDVLEDQLQTTLPAAAPLLHEALKDEDAAVRRSAALVLLRAGLEIETALPVLLEKLWSGKKTDDKQDGFQRRVV